MIAAQRTPTRNERRSSPKEPKYHLNPSPYGTHETIIRAVNGGGRTLDVGCATGYLGSRLAGQGCEMWGLDRDAVALEAASGHYREVQLIDLEGVAELPWPDEFFDTVVAADVLEHLRDPEPVLEMLRRYVRPGGRIVVSLPNVAHATVRLALVFGRFRYSEVGILDRTHLRLFTFRTARELVAAAGFRVESVCGGSDHLGAVVNNRVLGPLFRGMLAYSVVVVARPA